jgi:hypothetical protein
VLQQDIFIWVTSENEPVVVTLFKYDTSVDQISNPFDNRCCILNNTALSSLYNLFRPALAKIEKESFDTCIYKRLFLDYTYGLHRIYTKEEIEKAKGSPLFDREYCLKYLGLIGNVFLQSAIENCQNVPYNHDQLSIIPKYQ